VNLLEVPSATAEGGQDRGGRFIEQHGPFAPLARADVHQVDGRRLGVGVVLPRSAQSTQPEQPVTVARPCERARLSVGEACDPCRQPCVVLGGRAGDGLVNVERRWLKDSAEPAHQHGPGTGERSAWCNVVTTRAHGCPVHPDAHPADGTGDSAITGIVRSVFFS
jgi:hypothetical protein